MQSRLWPTTGGEKRLKFQLSDLHHICIFSLICIAFQRLAGSDPGRRDEPLLSQYAMPLTRPTPSPFSARKEATWASTPLPAPHLPGADGAEGRPSLCDVCDPVLSGLPQRRSPSRPSSTRPRSVTHALRALLRRARPPELRDEGEAQRPCGTALGPRARRGRARLGGDRPARWPISWTASRSTIPARRGSPASRQTACNGEIDGVIRDCAHRICWARTPRTAFLPTYAAFNLIGDPDYPAGASCSWR